MRLSRALLTFWSLFCVAGISRSASPDWLPVDPAELELTTSPLDPEAGAEILFRETTINGAHFDQTVATHYIRARIYSERGVEKLSKIELPYGRRSRLRDIQARTIKPDGTIIELDRDDVYDREVLKAGNRRIKVKSFAPPAIEPGVIVEYQYKQYNYQPAWFYQLSFQGKLPARHVRYRLRTIRDVPLAVQALFYNCPNQNLERDRDGYFTFDLKDLAAVEEEPFQPPDVHRNAMAFVYYITEKMRKSTPEEIWENEARDLHAGLEREAKVTKQIRAALNEIISPDDSPDQVVHKIFVHCRTRIRNRSYPDPDEPENDERERNNRTASHTLKHGSGTSGDIDLLFAALVRAAGLEVRLVRCNDRDLVFFDEKVPTPFTVTDPAVAVRIGDSWRFYAPGDPYLPAGMLNWNNSAVTVLLSDPKQALFQNVPANDSEASTRVRRGTFKLHTDGTLEGDVSITFTGHAGADVRAQFAPEPKDRHEGFVRDEVQRNLKLAEVTNVRIEHLRDPEQPITMSFHLRVPAYAERTGSRLFIQPSVFQKGEPVQFTAATRTSDIIYRYRSTETDEITIEPPEGFSLEAGSSPGELGLGNFGAYKSTIGVTQKQGLIKYHRNFRIDALLVPKSRYKMLQTVYQAVQERDGHVLTLKRTESPIAAEGATTAEASPAPAAADVPVTTTL